MNKFQIRKAIPADLSRIVELCGLHAEFEQSKVKPSAVEAQYGLATNERAMESQKRESQKRESQKRESQKRESQKRESQERESRQQELQIAFGTARVAGNESYPQNGESSSVRLAINRHQRPKAAALGNLLFGITPSIHCLVAEYENSVEGFATFVLQYSTWEANQYLYVDCLYLTEQARGLGIGKQLMARIRDMAIEMDCFEIQWQTPIFNDAAIQFYLKLGAEYKTKQRFTWKITDDNEA